MTAPLFSSRLIHTAATLITTKFASVDMIMSIIPPTIPITIVRWTIRTIAITTAVVFVLMMI